MTWVGAKGFARRPIVIVEDHLYHIAEMLEALAAADPAIPAQASVACLDRPGPDTTRAALAWLAAWPGLQVAAAAEPGEAEPIRHPLFRPLDPAVFTGAHRLCATLAGMLRPGGLLVQDVQLSTLPYLAADRWWESIYLASTVRGMFAERPPACRFVSNKRGYEATFGRDLLEAGFDPRDVMDKGELAKVVAPTVSAWLDRAFPLALEIVQGAERLPGAIAGAADREEVERELDLVLWPGAAGGAEGVELGGRAFAPAGACEPGRPRLALKPGQEALTWRQLVDDRFSGGAGLPVLEVGRRVAPEGAGRAEVTNCAARHLHALRGRLADDDAIVTAGHAYRLSDRLKLGRAGTRLSPRGEG
jgi:hypothetical protein